MPMRWGLARPESGEKYRCKESHHGLATPSSRQRERESRRQHNILSPWRVQDLLAKSAPVEQMQAAEANCLWVFPLASLLTEKRTPQT